MRKEDHSCIPNTYRESRDVELNLRSSIITLYTKYFHFLTHFLCSHTHCVYIILK